MRRTDPGFTLVEIIIVLLISGLFLTITTTSYLRYMDKMTRDNTQESMSLVVSALTEFVGTRGYYPCPADPTLGVNDPDYGWEMRDTVTGACTGWRVFDASAADGVSTRDENGDGIPDRIAVGAVPFRTFFDPDRNGNTLLGITHVSKVRSSFANPPSWGLDGWGRKLTYGVSVNLTRIETYNPYFGVVSILDEHENSVISPPASAHMVLLSHGKNGIGAFTENGNPYRTCVVSVCTTDGTCPGFWRDERDNCNFQDSPNSRFISGLRSNSFDDYVSFRTNRTFNIWRTSGVLPDGGGGFIPQITNTNPGNLGIGISNNPVEQLHVVGNARAIATRTESLCDTGGTDCLPPQVIGGNLPEMRCPAGEVVVRIQENHVECEPLFSTAVIETCPTGQYARGLSSFGHLICAPL